MNATFNIQRLGLTIYKELQEKYLTILGTIGIVLLAYLFLWGINLLGHDPVPADNRIASVTFILNIVTCLAPFIIYKNENRRMEGVFYAVTPASTLEKTISMIVICSIIFPILATVLTLSLDSFITIFPFDARYTGSLWSTFFSSKEYLDAAFNHPMIQYSKEAMDLYPLLKPLMISPFIGLILGQSVFLFLNMLFRRNKIGYTLLVLFIVWILGIIGLIVYATNYFEIVEGTGNNVTAETVYEWTLTWVKALIITVTYILPVIFWVLTYFRIRRIQY